MGIFFFYFTMCGVFFCDKYCFCLKKKREIYNENQQWVALPPKPGSWVSCGGGQPCAGKGERLYHIQHPAGAVPV